jgi:AraC family transcriptional regulator
VSTREAFPDSPSLSSYAVGVAIEPLFATDIFRIGRWKCVVGPEESTAVQSQRWPMMSFTHAGAFIVRSGGRSSVIDPSCALLINPGAPYRMSRHIGERSRGAYVLVRSDVFRDVARTGAVAPRGFSEIEGPSSTESYLLQHALLDRIAAEPAPDALEIDEMGMALLDAALSPAAPEEDGITARRRRQHATIQRVRALVIERLAEPMRLDAIARAAGLSPFHLCRVFRRITGRTLHRYRTILRLREAVDRLSEGKADIAQLSLDLGFSSHSHFTAAFRKEFGVSPSRMRKGKLRELGRSWMQEPARDFPSLPAADAIARGSLRGPTT